MEISDDQIVMFDASVFPPTCDFQKSMYGADFYSLELNTWYLTVLTLINRVIRTISFNVLSRMAITLSVHYVIEIKVSRIVINNTFEMDYVKYVPFEEGLNTYCVYILRHNIRYIF